MPLAITTGSPRFMSADTQTGVKSSFPLRSRSLKPPTPPALTGPCVTSNLNFEWTGPQNGARIHRLPTESSHVDNPVPSDSLAAPRRPHAPPLPALNVITLWRESSTLTAAIVIPAYVFAIQSTLPTRLSDHPFPVWNI